VGIGRGGLSRYVKALEIKLLRNKKTKYFSLEDIEKIKSRKQMAYNRDITGKKYGRLKAVRIHEHIPGKFITWEWECDCGNTFIAPAKNIVALGRKSCGCLQRERRANAKKAKKDCAAKTLYQNNTSGVRGVWWDKKKKKWVARITFKKKTIRLGCYKDLSHAAKARKEAEEKLFFSGMAQEKV